MRSQRFYAVENKHPENAIRTMPSPPKVRLLAEIVWVNTNWDEIKLGKAERMI